MKDIVLKEVLKSHEQLNKYLLAGLQLDDSIDSSTALCDYIVKLYNENRITLDDIRYIYYDYFHIDNLEYISYSTLVSCGVFGFEIEKILSSDNQLAKLKLISNGYALEELARDSDEVVENRAELELYKRERESMLPKHFKIICSQLNKEIVGCQLVDESLLINLIDDMFDDYSADCYAKVDYNEFTNTYLYAIKFHNSLDYDFTQVEAKRLLELESRFVVRDNQLNIYTNDDVDVQRVIDVLKFFFEEYM